MGNNAVRSVGIATGSVNVRSRVFPKTKNRAGGTYYAVFIGQHAQGGWSPDLAKVEARAKEIEKARRPCLCCGRIFLSQGAHNRLCDQCRRRDSGIL